MDDGGSGKPCPATAAQGTCQCRAFQGARCHSLQPLRQSSVVPDLDASFLPAGSETGGHRRLSEGPRLARFSESANRCAASYHHRGVLGRDVPRCQIGLGGPRWLLPDAFPVWPGFHCTLRHPCAATEGAKALSPDRQAAKLLLFGSLGFAGFSILAFIGLAHSTAEHGAIIMALMPLNTALDDLGVEGAFELDHARS